MDQAEIDAYIEYEKQHLHETKVPSLVAALTVSLVAAYFGVALRLLSRYLFRAKLGPDDYLILLALLFTTAFIVPNFVMIGIWNFGRHEILVPNPAGVTKTLLAMEIVYTAGIFCFKASICALFYNLFPVRWFRWTQIAVVAFVGAYSIVQVVCILVSCIPLRATWDTTVAGSCIDVNLVFIIISAFNIATDFVIIALPMPLLWGLNTTTSRKIQLSVMIGLGALVCISSIVRITTLLHLSFIDPSYTNADAAIWSALEMGFGTLGVSLPTYGPLLRFFRGGRHAAASANDATWTIKTSRKHLNQLQTTAIDDDDASQTSTAYSQKHHYRSAGGSEEDIPMGKVDVSKPPRV